MGTRAIHPVVIAALVAGLGGCASSAPISVTADTYCIASKRITWSEDDTQPTVEQILKHNSGIDRACGIAKGKKAPTS